MHIPNGFLDPKTSAGAALAAAAVLGYCLSMVKQALSHAVPEAAFATASNIATNMTRKSKIIMSTIAQNHLSKMGAIASLIFAAQMFNFPIDSGTSGHLIGGVLAALAVGPFSGTLVIASILVIQSIFFADGGIAVLGANILNMAVIGAFIGYYIYYIINKLWRSKYGFCAGVALSSFLSVLLASVACSFELAISGTISLGKILPAMASVHTRIGIAEALLTIISIGLLAKIDFEMEGRINNEK